MKHALRLIFFFIILLSGLFSFERSFGQTVTFNPETTNITPAGTLTGYTSDNVAVYGFSLTVTGAPETIGTVNIKNAANNVDLSTIFNNGRLYSTSTSGYNAANPGTAVGTVTFSAGLVAITGMNESFTAGETKYYYLVVDCISTTNTAFQPAIQYGQSPVGIISSGGTNYNNNSNGYENYYTIAAGTPPPLLVTNLTNSLTSNSSTLIPSQTGVVIFAFSIKTTNSYTFNKFNINSNSSTLSSYIASAKLYRSTNNTYTAGSDTEIGTTNTIGTEYINFTTSDETVNNTTRYYFMVVTLKSSFPAAEDIQFNFTDSQSTPALQRTTPNRDYNDFNVLGNTYNFNSSRLTVTSQQTGVSGSTITPEQTNVVLFGFGIQSTNAITLSQININSNNANADTYFGNGKLYYSVNNSYTAGAETLAGTVAFNGSYANVTLNSAADDFTAGQTRYYFLVADNIGAAASTTIAFNFISGQGDDAIVQSSPVASTYNTFTITGNTFDLPDPTIFVTGANSVSNGITQGVLSFGQTNIVLFGFGVEGFGASQTFTQINIKTSGMENQYFSNGRLYRSTTNVFPGGSPLYSGAAVSIGGGGFIVCTVNETIPAGTTYYYWFVADYTVNSGPPNAAYTFSFQSGQSSLAFTPTPYSTAYNTYNVTGQAFNIATTLDWVGGTSNSFTDATNFKTLNNSNGSVPINTTVVRIGGRAYTNAPVIAANTTIGGLTFGSVVASPTLAVNSGITLTLNNAFNVLSGSSPTINGAGSVTLISGSFSSIDDGATLNLAGAAKLNNAGTFTMAPTSILNVTGNSTVTNTNIFTLRSAGTGSATIGPVTGSLVGNYNVERYITGGQSYSRGYRLLSSPVSVSAASLIWPNLTFIHNKTYTTGTGGATNGFDAVGNPNMYLYRENKAPDFSTFISGNSRGIAKINNTTASSFNVDGDAGTFNIRAGNGLLLFFRGDRATTTDPTNTASIAQPTTFTQTGYLNQGNIVVRNWFTPAATTLSYTAATPVSVRGFNFVGNPYASSINWDNITGTALSNTIWIYNPKLKVYATYVKGTGGIGTNFNGSPANIIPSGQGFYVKATSTSAALTFTEAHKVNTQIPQSGLLLATAPVNPADIKYMRLQVIKDSLNMDESLIFFNDTASVDFSANEDAEYLPGVNQVNISTKATNNTALAINQLPFPVKSRIIPLNVNVPADGAYQLAIPEVQNIPQLYQVWLKDAYSKDSLNLKGTKPVYNFNAVLSDSTTFKNRFSVVIGIDGNYAYQLLDFNATKQTTSVKLAWLTANESNNTYFTIERSADGVTYTTIGTLRSNGQGNYEFIDNSPVLNDKNFYRLRQEDFNGVITYSKAIPITFVNGSNVTSALITLYPNPSSSTINIVIDQVDPDVTPEYTITITGSAGRTLTTVSISQNTWQGDISKLTPGTYYVQVINETNKKVIGKTRFVKL